MSISLLKFRLSFAPCRKRHDLSTTVQDAYFKLGNPGYSHLSLGEISNLAWLFLVYLEELHNARSDKLRAALKSDGGWPLHADATGEDGRGTLLVVYAGWRNWVLGSWKIPTERAEVILSCLREVVLKFGTPCAMMRDLGAGMTNAMNELSNELEPDIRILACHSHFLRDIGKDLCSPAHVALRGLFRETKIRPKLRALARDLGLKLGAEIEQARKEVETWQAQTDFTHSIPAGQAGVGVRPHRLSLVTCHMV